MITVVILTKNEEKNIVDCLERLSFCDEVLIIDDNSFDRTVEISKKMGARVFVRPLNNDFSKQRNFGLEKAKNEWVLFIDADERINGSLSEEIKKKTVEENYDAFFIRRVDTIWGKKMSHGELGSVWKLRLALKNSGKWAGAVHENWFVQGRVGKLTNVLDHYPHQSIAEYVREVNYYTDLRAKELHSLGVKINWFSILLYPKLKFFLNYFLKFGFLDGIPGLLVAIMMSFHSFLVRGKLWLLNQKRPQ